MRLRSTLSNTKKFFQKTLENFKSLFSAGYQRLPKTPLPTVLDLDNNYPSFKNLDMLDSEFTDDQWDSEQDKARRRKNKCRKKNLLPCPSKQEKDQVYDGSFISCSNGSPDQKKNQVEITGEKEHDNQNSKKSLPHQIKGRQEDSSLSPINIGEKEGGGWMQVAEKLKELENELDMGNSVDYVMDMEEVIHYYSRLTCPAYLQIVDKFCMEICSDFFGPSKPCHC